MTSYDKYNYNYNRDLLTEGVISTIVSPFKKIGSKILSFFTGAGETLGTINQALGNARSAADNAISLVDLPLLLTKGKGLLQIRSHDTQSELQAMTSGYEECLKNVQLQKEDPACRKLIDSGNRTLDNYRKISASIK